MERVRRLFAKQGDPYAGGDIRAALRIGSVLWAMGLAIAILLTVFSPPDEAIGGSGWIVGLLLSTAGAGAWFAFRSDRVPWTFDRLYLTSYLVIPVLGIMQWLAGGVGAPYERLLLLTVVFVSSLYPPRKIAAFMLAVALALAAPFLYDGWNTDAAAGSLATFLIWCAVAGIAHMLMRRVRAQRLRLRRGTQEAREEARIDNLTGIGNRRAFEEAIENEVSRARRTKVPLSMAMGDIEDFKRINDEWGHLEGDVCLRSVATSLSEALRLPDRCFRWGGDEFALLFPGTPAEGAIRVSERLRIHVGTGATRPDGEPLLIRFGTAELIGGMEPAALVEAADLALLSSRSVDAEADEPVRQPDDAVRQPDGPVR